MKELNEISLFEDDLIDYGNLKKSKINFKCNSCVFRNKDILEEPCSSCFVYKKTYCGCNYKQYKGKDKKHVKH